MSEPDRVTLGATRTTDVRYGTCIACGREYWYPKTQPYNDGPIQVINEVVVHCPCGFKTTEDGGSTIATRSVQ